MQRYLGFLNYYRNYIPRLSEKLVPFFQLLKKDEKVLVTSELIEQFNEINRDLDRCSQLALRQPLPNRQLVLMTDASFTAAGYAILTEDDPNQKFTSVKKSYAPIAYGSKTFIPSQLKMSIYAKEFLAIYYAFKEFGHIFWGTPKPVIILTDNKSVTRFFQTKIIPPPLWNACDFVIQFNFIIAHIPGKNNTAADYLSRMEMEPTEKLVLKIRADVETQPIEVNVQSAGVSEEEQVFFTEEDNETEEQIWERKRQSKAGIKVPETVIQIDAISENIVEEITNFTQKLRRTNQILLEQSKDPILLQLKAKIQNEEYSEEILQQDIRYRHYLNNLDRIVLKDEIVTRKYYDRKAKAAPLKENDYCFVLQPKADSQASKIPFREYRWIGPFVVQTVLSNDNYIVRRLNTNKTQILHRIRLKKFVPNAPLEDKYEGEKLQPDNEIVIPQDDLYSISWEVDFEYDLFEPRKEDWTDVATRRPTDTEDGSADHYVIENERSSASENESCSERINEDDVTENEIWPTKKNNSDESSPLNETPYENDNENDVTNDFKNTESVSNRGADITVPGISEKESFEENSSPRGGRYILRPNPNPNFTDEYRY